jgi:hypothetical protein
MPQDVGQLQIPMDDLVLVQMVEPVDELAHNADALVLNEVTFLLDIRVQVSVVAVLHDQIIVVTGLLHVVELDDVGTLATLEHFDLAFQQLLELP